MAWFSYPLAEDDVEKTQHQQGRKPDRYAAEHKDRSDSMADRSRFSCPAEAGNVRHHAGNRRAECGADRAH